MKAEGPAKSNSLALGGLSPYVPAEFRNLGSAAFALLTGILIWHMPAPSTLGETGLHFLATLSVAIILWIFETLDDYVVALLLLLSWLALAKLPTEIALSGFASSEWFFALAAIGIAASITKVGLLRRLALVMLTHVPASYTVYIYILSFSGLLVTPFLPNVKGRMALAAPVTQAVSTALNFKPRSNPSAGLALSTYVGFSQMSFMFLTGTSSNLIAWNLLPDSAKEQFGWGTWTLVALPAGFFTLAFLVTGIRFCFPPIESGHERPAKAVVQMQLRSLGPLSSGEWISIVVMIMALVGWLSKPLHGVSEAWVALACFMIFLLTGLMRKDDVKDGIDWSFLLLFGVISSMGDAVRYLKIDNWLMEVVTPLLSSFASRPELFLTAVLFLVYMVRFVLHKAPVVLLLMVGLMPWAESLQIHPGLLAITVLLGVECWFLPYQTDSYLIAYSSTGGSAFSHRQGQKVMLLKFITSFLALGVSIPYWRALGLMH